MCYLLHNPVAWWLDCEAWVERCLGVLPLGKNIQRFAAVPRSYRVCTKGDFDVLGEVMQEGVRKVACNL